jgi:hypothetical protein
LLRPAATLDPQSPIAALLTHLAWPRLAETEHSHPTPPLGHAIATEGTRSELHATDRSPTHHLATGLAQTPLINSPNQMTAIPTVHVAMTSPDRRRRAAQHAQSALRVPVHQHIL